eukprot:Amastigsp_a842064_437.p3 type:complete len:115 gc:universal Amastigsp_a842064_437:764-420(-)
MTQRGRYSIDAACRCAQHARSTRSTAQQPPEPRRGRVSSDSNGTPDRVCLLADELQQQARDDEQHNVHDGKPEAEFDVRKRAHGDGGLVVASNAVEPPEHRSEKSKEACSEPGA